MLKRARWFIVLILFLGIMLARAQNTNIREIPIVGELAGVVLSPDGQRIVTFENGVMHSDVVVPEYLPIRLYDVATGAEIAAFTGHTDYASSAVFSADSRTLFTYHNHGYIHIWDVETRELTRRIPALPGYLRMSLFPGGRTLAVMAGNNQAVLFNIETGHITQVLMRRYDTFGEFREREIPQGPMDSFAAMAITPDGQSLVVATIYGRIHLWDVETGAYRLIRDTAEARPALNIRQLWFTPDGSTLIFPHRQDAMIYGLEVATGDQTFAVPSDGVWFGMSNDGTRMAWFAESTLHIMNFAQPDETIALALPLPEGLRVHAAQLALAFTPDNTQLILGGFPALDGNNSVFVIDIPGS